MVAINFSDEYVDMVSVIIHRMFTLALIRYGATAATEKMRALLDGYERFMQQEHGLTEVFKPNNMSHREYAEHIFAAVAARCEPRCRETLASVFGEGVEKKIPAYLLLRALHLGMPSDDSVSH